MLIDLNTVNYVGHELILLRTYLLYRYFPVFEVTSSTIYCILEPFFFLKSLHFYPNLLCNIVETFSPLKYAPMLLSLCYIVSLTFILGGKGGFISSSRYYKRLCALIISTKKTQEKYLQGIFCINPPHYVLYLSIALRCFYFQPVNIPYLLPNLFCNFHCFYIGH